MNVNYIKPYRITALSRSWCWEQLIKY